MRTTDSVQSAPRSFSFYFTISAVVILLDQISKSWIEARYDFMQFEPITSFFNLGLTYNPGAAFSFLASHSGWQKWFFTVLAIAASIFLFYQIYTELEKRIQNFGFAMIAGGALGNPAGIPTRIAQNKKANCAKPLIKP